jgi:hypothetical protein
MQTDFSFSNPSIRKYFDGDDSSAPTRELVYLHSHPLIQPNFVTEINNLVAEAVNKLNAQKVSKTSKWVTELEDLCIKLGRTMPEVKISQPEETLVHLRSLHNLCNKIMKA